jgi:nucleoside diphosphate kinase
VKIQENLKFDGLTPLEETKGLVPCNKFKFVSLAKRQNPFFTFLNKITTSNSINSIWKFMYSRMEGFFGKKTAKRTKNTAFLFIKPHANTPAAQELVSNELKRRGLAIVNEGEFNSEQIDQQMLIDQHYYAIASKATLLKPEEIPVPAAKFQENFGLSWADAQAQGRAFNALDACKHLGVDAAGLDAIWNDAKKVKFGGGFYCGELKQEGKPSIFVFNAFFMTMRSKFVAPGTSIHYYVVEFDSEFLAWSDFRGKVLGPTDPKAAPADSLRGQILTRWTELGLGYEPNVGDNSVHASASPFEGLAERMNWLKASPAEDTFGRAAMAAGISEKTLREWSVDPQVNGKSIFDQLEDTDAQECLDRMVALNKKQ